MPCSTVYNILYAEEMLRLAEHDEVAFLGCRGYKEMGSNGRHMTNPLPVLHLRRPVPEDARKMPEPA
jgi:hypothetical protein